VAGVSPAWDSRKSQPVRLPLYCWIRGLNDRDPSICFAPLPVLL